MPLKLEYNDNSTIVQNQRNDIINDITQENNFIMPEKEIEEQDKCEVYKIDIISKSNDSMTENTYTSNNTLIETEETHNSDSNSEKGSEVYENRSEMTCRYCDIKFRSKVRLKKHEAKHKSGFKCHLCSKIYPTSRQLHNHLNIHSRKGSHLCQTCGKQFTLPENLARHQRIHLGVKPFKCDICGK